MSAIGSEWAKAVVHPLGLAGFALFVILTFFSKLKKTEKRPWQTPALFAAAIAALLGGLYLAHRCIQSNALASQQKVNRVQQISTGQGSPNVQDAQGDVNITVDQSTGKTEAAKPDEKKPEGKK
jgi:hypothetical protein